MSTIRLTFWQTAALLVILVAAAAVTFLCVGDFGSNSGQARLEAVKAILQFGLVTSGGGLLLAYLNKRRDDEEHSAEERRRKDERKTAERAAAQERAAVRRSALQELVIELGDAHRKLKVVKRQMRAQIMRQDPGNKDEFSVRADAFERAMDGLLNAQIAAEEVRDRISLRSDLLDDGQIVRVRRALRYGARYFHDVYQDYERCLVTRKENYYEMNSTCVNLINFLTAKSPPSHLEQKHIDDLELQFRVLKNDDRSLEQRHAALERIEQLREQDPQHRRYRVVATECFALAADEIREAARQ